MSKIIVLLTAVIACVGCAESSRDVSLSTGGYGGASPGGGESAAAARVVARDVAPREIVVHHASRRDGEFVVCAQCRQ
jgi:hypothetical protein